MHGYEHELVKRRQRATDYWNGMKNCKLLAVPHLYICSKDDKLTPYGPLSELISHRERKNGKNLTHSLVFEQSSHCRHILKHPEEFEESIRAFLDLCGRSRGRNHHLQMSDGNRYKSRL